MMRRVASFVLAVWLAAALFGCAEEPTAPVALTNETAVYEGEGYTLTYPACFTLVGETKKMVNFAASGRNMAFTVTIEDNPHGAREIEEYPDLMGIYDGVKFLNEHSFAVERYQPNVLSAYYLYAMTADVAYLLEYHFGGTEEQRAMEPLFAIDPV